MISVKFADNNQDQEDKCRKREELLDIINHHPNWMFNAELTKRVQLIGSDIGAATMDESKPIEYINPKTFCKREYKFLKFLGYSDKAIYKAMNKTKRAFEIYKNDQLKLSKEDLKDVKRNK